MSLYVLALEGVFDTGLAAICDTLGTADELGATGGRSLARFGARVVGVRRRVRTMRGLRVPVAAAAELPRPDVALVPALGHKTPSALRAVLARPDLGEAGELLRGWAAGGTVVAAACTGTFVLGAAGLLDGGRATTSWWLAPLFRELFPRVELDESRMVVKWRRRLTAGAALAHFDLGLWLVRQRSPQLAALTARYLVIEPRPSQAMYALSDHLAHADPLVERFERWARQHLGRRFSLSEATRAVAVSERTLLRRMRSVLGRSPLEFVQDLRVERAVHRLQTSDASVDEIAAEVGYADGVTLRTLLRRRTGRGVRELRGRAP